MTALTCSALEGTSEATTHYMNGQYDMAEESQANAGEVPEPEPVSPRDRALGGENVPF